MENTSNIAISKINFLEGANVFVLDTETTGIPDRVPKRKWGSRDQYWSHQINDKYEKSRIVSIAWSHFTTFAKYNASQNTIHNYIRYPEGFSEIPTANIHGITFEIALTSGIPFVDILEKYNLAKHILQSEYIIAHNVMFDIHILLNELYRNNTTLSDKCITHITNLLDNNKCICTGEISLDICKLPFASTTTTTTINQKILKKTSNIKYKIPKLVELYKFLYNGEDFINQHTADGDVKALLKVLEKL
jgi:DNA polymerase III epsilon subunit-like protein